MTVVEQKNPNKG